MAIKVAHYLGDFQLYSLGPPREALWGCLRHPYVIDPHTKGGSMVFANVNAFLSKTENELKARFYLSHEEQFTRDM